MRRSWALQCCGQLYLEPCLACDTACKHRSVQNPSLLGEQKSVASHSWEESLGPVGRAGQGGQRIKAARQAGGVGHWRCMTALVG